MQAGIFVPVGHMGDYHGWDRDRAWARTVDVARHAERLGFSSLWVPDHFQNIQPAGPAETICFDSFVTLAALARETERARLGHQVMCALFRNPALTAKMISTLDVVSGGRAVLGIGAGWNREEFEAYGYDFPPARERLETLREDLEVITRMLAPGRATYEGQRARVREAVNEPRGLQEPRVRIVVGGNGPEVTWRLAARYADELNLDALSVEQVTAALPVIRQRCEEIGRDPESLPVSLLVWWADRTGSGRVEELQALAELGLCRVDTLLDGCVESDEVLEAYAAECRAADVNLS